MTGGVDRFFFLLILQLCHPAKLHWRAAPAGCSRDKGRKPDGEGVTGWLGEPCSVRSCSSWRTSCLRPHVDTFSFVLGWPFRKNPANLCQWREHRRGRQWGEGELGHLLPDSSPSRSPLFLIYLEASLWGKGRHFTRPKQHGSALLLWPVSPYLRKPSVARRQTHHPTLLCYSQLQKYDVRFLITLHLLIVPVTPECLF